MDFDDAFRVLTGTQGAFPWQKNLYEEFLKKRFRNNCDVPTGLGKTAVIAVWLLALAHHAQRESMEGFPRRLLYVVNRRTVVDQATREAERLRAVLVTNAELSPIADRLRALCVRPDGHPVAISTLRGQFADNAEWRDDPARPAVVVGTVDMMGSRLLFGGYGCGFRSKPLHAGLFGQDALLVHDEAHLEPAFQTLAEAIRSEQERHGEFRTFHLMELTATSRCDPAGSPPIFSEVDRNDPRVRERFAARKGMTFHSVANDKEIAGKVSELALRHKSSGAAVLIFLRKLDHLEKVRRDLEKSKQQVQVLTGTMRGLERDNLARNDRVFARFLPKPEAEPAQGTVYLVCTSAGEVGVDISADHMVCDLTPFDSMAQRLGRVNRFGNGDAAVDVVHLPARKGGEARGKHRAGSEQPASDGGVDTRDGGTDRGQPVDEREEKTPFDSAVERTLAVLQGLPRRSDGAFDASPAALRDLPAEARQAAFTPPPIMCSSSDILFDTWALTSVRGTLPGRPPVADWLHGKTDWEPLDTYVAWREEVALLDDALLDRHSPEDLLEEYPFKPQELLRDQTHRVVRELETLAERSPELRVWLVEFSGRVLRLTLGQLVEKNWRRKPIMDLADCTVVLPPDAGGLDVQGMLNGETPLDAADRDRYDVSAQWRDEEGRARRYRVWDDEDPPEGMRLVRTIDLQPDVEEPEADGEQPRRRFWRWYVRPRSADDDGSRTAQTGQDLNEHLQAVEDTANRLVGKLVMNEPEATAVRLAARWHDLGKNRAIWQRSIGNRDFPRTILAKSGPGMRPLDITPYRHEFGSLLEIKDLPEFQALDGDTQDLVLHLVAAHHGRARPHFPDEEVFDPDRSEADAACLAREVPRRFARLQRKYGRWGLAYLESLVRAADALASQALGSKKEA